METMTDLIFLGSKTTADGDCSHEIKRYSLEESYDKPRQCIKKQRHHFANKGPYSQSYGFSSSHARAGPKRWLSIEELRVPWTARKSNQSILKETNPECLLDGWTDAETEAPILWPPDLQSCLFGKDPDAGKD